MAAVAIFRTGIAPEWIDYNGHVRDAYYGLILSLAVDALMQRIGLDEAYRNRSGCTLYTLETHIHYLREIKAADNVAVGVRILDSDHKRIHAAFELCSEPQIAPAATAEVMLLHVRQSTPVATAPFEPAALTAIDALRQAGAALAAAGPGSRRMQLRPQ